jgi:hypothetical protein
MNTYFYQTDAVGGTIEAVSLQDALESVIEKESLDSEDGSTAFVEDVDGRRLYYNA